ncbi:TetR/AcrR family transcriptional regulator [Streptomyces venezuelae]|uniref:TetR family transcriptional regulator n=1 Tax=Streptomyces venezuelae TaxID=54571 RepID=A0A5P2BT51_STRVZ|nr:TetR/AcrR family transcriptional regulator [Streptomyces venezuelae]QES33483.1 TetR family transcriptional regulator [Streptomyces venezuelae]
MPTGVAIRDVREQLFAAAERVLLRDGPNALTSRAVTTEAGCAKGVLHRHFDDFDAFLAELVRDRIGEVEGRGAALSGAAGTGTVAGNVAAALTDLFGPLALGVLGLVASRDALRARLRRTTPVGIPLLTEAGAVLAAYLAAERDLGRLVAECDPDALAFTVVGSGHLLFAGRDGGAPPAAEVRRVVGTVLAGATPQTG